MSGQLDEISRAIGRIESQQSHTHDCIHRVEDAIKDVETKVADVDKKVDDLKADLNIDKEELAKLKAKGTGVLVGVALVSGFAGAKLAAIGQLLGTIISK